MQHKVGTRSFQAPKAVTLQVSKRAKQPQASTSTAGRSLSMGRWGLPHGSHCFSMFLILILSRWGDPSAKTCKTPTRSSPMMELRNDKIVHSSLGLNLSISHCFFPYFVRRKPYPLDGFKRSDKLRKHQQTKATSVRSTPLFYSRLERLSLHCLCSMLPSSHSLAFNVWIAKFLNLVRLCSPGKAD